MNWSQHVQENVHSYSSTWNLKHLMDTSVVGVLNKSTADCWRAPFCNLSSPHYAQSRLDREWATQMGWTLRCSQQYLKDLGQTAPCKGLKTLQCIHMFFNYVFIERLPQWILLEIYPRNMAFRIRRNNAHHEDVIGLKVLLLNQIFQIQVYLDKVQLNFRSSWQACWKLMNSAWWFHLFWIVLCSNRSERRHAYLSLLGIISIAPLGTCYLLLTASETIWTACPT
jgi:hypothetical protein